MPDEVLEKILRTELWCSKAAREAIQICKHIASNREYTSLASSSFGIGQEDFAKILEKPTLIGDLLARRGVHNVEGIEFNGFISRYLDYTADQEAPALFHLWIAVFAVSSALGRRSWLDRGHYTIYPNQYVILLAPSGVCRRTTACDIGIEMLRDIGMNILADKFTPEQLPYDLSTGKGFSEGVIYASELGMLLDRKKYNEGLVKLLTDFYGCPRERAVSTRKNKKVVVENVCINLLGTCPPDEFVETLPIEVTKGGFLARCMTLYIGEKPRRIFQATPNTEAKTALIRELKGISSMSGAFAYDSKEAFDWMREWYESMSAPDDAPARSFGYYERKHDHALKLAMILSASRSSNMQVSIYDLLKSTTFLEKIEPYIHKAGGLLEVSVVGKDQQMLLNFFARRKRMIHSEFVARGRSKLTKKAFTEAIESLVQAGKLRRVKDKDSDFWEKIE